MKMWVLIYFIGILGAAAENFTFTYNMALQCKEHLSQHGYNYDTYYLVESDQRKIVRSDPSIIFEMHIAILGGSNGHILLSTVPRPSLSDPVYEIVVGGGSNKFTELRGNLKRNARASAKTVGILSTIEFRAFYIKITEDGLIEFGREGDILPVLSYQDMDPITVRYFSFAAWNGVEAKFLYDCPIPLANGTEGPSSDSAMVEPTLSNSDMLKRSLLMNRDPNIAPRSKVTVQLGIKITSVMYDAFESKLRTGMSVVRKWTDDSMAWNPLKFNGTTHLTFSQGQIWSPSLSVYNSDKIAYMDAKNSEPITMVESGENILHMQTSVQTWCVDYSETLNKWPHDDYACTLVIEPWEVHEKIEFQKLDNGYMKAVQVTDFICFKNPVFCQTSQDQCLSPTDSSHKPFFFADIDEVIQNAWEVTTTQYVQNSTTWNQIYNIENNNSQEYDRFIIEIYLKRKATAYNIVFYTPLLVLVTFVLLSFWTEPLNMKRIWFYACCIVVVCMGLCNIDFLVPCHNIPSILVLYTAVLGGVILALIIHVALMTSLAKRLCKTFIIQEVLTAQWLRTLFFLPMLKVCQKYETVNEDYDQNDDEDLGGSRNGSIEAMQSDNKEYNESMEVAEVLDKIMFVIYSLTFAVMLTLHF